MLFLSQEMLSLKQEIAQLRQTLHSNTYPTQVQHPTHTPTHDLQSYSLNQPNFHSSIGNEGVPTDRQTDNRQTPNRQSNTLKRTSGISDTSEIASILGTLKQDLRAKFKTLTKQEFLIFSVLYTLEEELKQVTYKDLAKRAGLTESSIRDYILRLERKGIPIQKEKVNNKIILLKIPREFKEITPLNSLNHDF